MAIGEISSNHLYASQQNNDTVNAFRQQVEQERAAADVNKPIESTGQQSGGLKSSQQQTAENNASHTNTQSGNNDKSAESEKLSIRAEANLSDDQVREVKELNVRDREVRSHEAAHAAAAGAYAQGGPTYAFKRGPDGNSYAVGGEVKIDTSVVPGNPEATIRKARQIKAAATAPVDPSAQDRSVAASAAQMQAVAQQTLAEERLDAIKETTSHATSESTEIRTTNKESQPASDAYAEVAHFKDQPPAANDAKGNIDQVI